MSDLAVKKIKLTFEPDKMALIKIDRELEKLGEKISLSDEDKDILRNTRLVQNEIEQLKATLSQFEGIETDSINAIKEELQNKIDEYENLLNPEEELGISEEALEEENDTRAKLQEKLLTGLQNIESKFLEKLKEIFKGAWDELSNLMNYSRLSQSQTRELAFTYGFSASEAYGYSQAMKALGLTSEEDLYYMTEKELELFRAAFKKYSDKYEKLYDEGTFETLLEYKTEMNEFMQDIKLEVADFYMDNKDAIKSALQAIITIANIITKIPGWLLGTSNKNTTTTSDIIANYTNSRATTNISIDNTFNGVDSSSRTTLLRIGTDTAEQLINALNA